MKREPLVYIWNFEILSIYLQKNTHTMEIWRDIEGYEGVFQVSNEGRIKSVERVVEDIFNGKKRIRPIKERILILYENSNGHLRAELHYNNKRERLLVHQIVAKAFIPNPNNYEIVHHIDHNPQNNVVENLIWMSDEEHRAMHAVQSLSKKVYQYTLEGELVKIWDSLSDVGRNGFSYYQVWKCCNGKAEQHKGFRWSYIPL